MEMVPRATTELGGRSIWDEEGNEVRIPRLIRDWWYQGECKSCGLSESIHWCNRCAQTVYCSLVCQGKDWRNHEPECWELPRSRMRSWVLENGDKPGGQEE